ncbi:hypothetical protein ACFW88_04145 [Streptomyces anandii]|uniref:Uncharacterized protein n=1 Tax=Streptomyces anandii TaxID=285454 RepID=A0ABW6GZE7_9ACTN
MTSDNTASCEVTRDWFGWVSVPGRGRAWVSGHVSVPACTPRAEVYRLIGVWLRERGCAVPADLSRAITLLPATGDTRKGV